MTKHAGKTIENLIEELRSSANRIQTHNSAVRDCEIALAHAKKNARAEESQKEELATELAKALFLANFTPRLPESENAK